MDDVREGRLDALHAAAGRLTRPRHPQWLRPSALVAVLVVLAQIAYPLAPPEPLRLLTISTVLAFAAASTLHAVATRGAAWAMGLICVAGGIGFLAEVVGVHTGIPFGRYSYADSLGPKALGVPLIVPFAWVMMAYPCLLLGRRLARGVTAGSRTVATVVATTGGLTLAAWDLFLDPQMVAAHHWTWANPTPSLPGVAGVPVTNNLGWVVVAIVMVGTLHHVLPDTWQGSDAVPAALLAWTWIGSTLGNAVFFHRPAVALWGGLAMGVLTAPYLYLMWRDRR